MHTTIRIQSYTYIHAYMHEFIHKNKPPIITSAASIWFEIWGSWIRVKKFDVSRQFHKEKIDFLGQISEIFRFLTDDFTKKIHLFQSKFPKNVNFFRQFHKKFRFSEKNPQNFDFFQVISLKISIFWPF